MPFDLSALGSPRLDLGGDIEIINEPPASYAPAFGRRGASSRGKQRTTIEIRSEPLLFDLDDLALGQGPAIAIRDQLSAKTKAISEDVRSATAARRRYAADNPGAPWVAKRYSGGRTGFKAPNQTQPPRLFNDSGRLADGWFVRENKEDRTWTVNVPANRLDPATFDGGDGPAFQQMLERLRGHIDILQDTRAIGADPKFNAAVSEAMKQLAVKGELSADAASTKRLQALSAARKRAAMAALRAIQSLVDV